MNKPHDDDGRRRRGGDNGPRGERGRSTPRGARGDSDHSGRRGGRDQRAERSDRDFRGGRRGSRDREEYADRGERRGGQYRREERDGRFRDRDERPRAERSDRESRSGRRDTPGSRDRRTEHPRPATRTGRDSERELSARARARLRTLRAEYDPGDDDPADDERDTYADVPGGIRLQKALAQAGVASRRASEELIATGRVTVDGQVVRRFGARVDPEKSEIRVDGMRVVTSTDLRYYALNKPRGVVSTMDDPQGRPTLADYAGQSDERLFHVGRLDTETEGLILLTNDGELANRLTHPRYKVVKTYIAKVPGPVPREVVRRVRGGVELDDGFVEVDSFRVVDNVEPKALVEIRLHEGRKHIVRRLMEAVGHPVSDLARTQIGPVGLNNLKVGTVRALTSKEISELYTAAGM
ncbi:pseudouridine synthase [Thermobifida halotolerans]|uniref:pseudouridine synthase n=1 Tax=Thermobifida halotolerans TaxID=483545 RepID=UPI0009FE7B92|nr:pseudouridine synthase [Thermobifida halotolerans]